VASAFGGQRSIQLSYGRIDGLDGRALLLTEFGPERKSARSTLEAETAGATFRWERVEIASLSARFVRDERGCAKIMTPANARARAQRRPRKPVPPSPPGREILPAL
jgi:hypothetical protein